MEIIIDDLLATHGALFTPHEKMASTLEQAGWLHMVDTRDMKDGYGNHLEEYEDKIEEALQYIRQDIPTCIVCTFGKSRSNAIAAGVVSRYYGRRTMSSVDDAVTFVRARTGGFALIHRAHVEALRKLEQEYSLLLR